MTEQEFFPVFAEMFHYLHVLFGFQSLERLTPF